MARVSRCRWADCYSRSHQGSTTWRLLAHLLVSAPVPPTFHVTTVRHDVRKLEPAWSAVGRARRAKDDDLWTHVRKQTSNGRKTPHVSHKRILLRTATVIHCHSCSAFSRDGMVRSFDCRKNSLNYSLIATEQEHFRNEAARRRAGFDRFRIIRMRLATRHSGSSELQ